MPSTATSRLLPVKWRHPLVTSGHVGSRVVISCHVTATTRELQSLRSSNVPKTWLIRLLQPLPNDFRSNDATSGHMKAREVISCHVTATSCELQPCRSSNVPKPALLAFYSHFHVTSDQMTPLPGHFWSRGVTWRHFLSRDCHLLRVTAL